MIAPGPKTSAAAPLNAHNIARAITRTNNVRMDAARQTAHSQASNDPIRARDADPPKATLIGQVLLWWGEEHLLYRGAVSHNAGEGVDGGGYSFDDILVADVVTIAEGVDLDSWHLGGTGVVERADS